MKSKMFEQLYSHNKIIDGKKIEKVIIANRDSKDANYFLNFKSDKKITYSINNDSDYHAHDVCEKTSGVTFELEKHLFEINILGKFNVFNALPAIIISRLFNIDDNLIEEGLKKLAVIPGRMEKINEGQKFTVLVDYAHEKESITNVLETIKNLKKENSKSIILLGAEGGGRDKAKRPIMGKIAAEKADIVIVSNVDPYDDDPKEILEDIATSAEQYGKKRNEDLLVIEDRREGIKKALLLAGEDDIVLITGKGAEQSMVIGEKRLKWDDRIIVKEELKSIIKS